MTQTIGPSQSEPPVAEVSLLTSESTATDPRHFVVEAARCMEDLHCQDIVVFDVRRLSPLTDYIIVASGMSDRQIRGVAQHLGRLATDWSMQCLGVEQDATSTWLVLDLIEVMVHLFEPITRVHYDLEMLWGDAPRIPWQRNGSIEPIHSPHGDEVGEFS